MAGQPTAGPRNKGLIAGLTKGNQWLINLMRPEYPHFRGGGGGVG